MLQFGKQSLTALCGVYGGSVTFGLLRVEKCLHLICSPCSFECFLIGVKRKAYFLFLHFKMLSILAALILCCPSIHLIYGSAFFFFLSNKTYYLSKKKIDSCMRAPMCVIRSAWFTIKRAYFSSILVFCLASCKPCGLVT